ncbi:histidine kinase [Aeromicrobium sp. Root495]|uniref:ATP-binding protein n=1 Tax=Aeromicrobium sp. Root495 TaxID=1736550 RepID=UPI0006F2E757|nr:ATP-binding protein [Aeromicrobium sp. Root495]KQY58664.1 histidine kinase [Aeromicrobium sp. Root495]
MVDSARGSLRVYLGAAPGVGKTFAMLDEGSRRAARGTDVVVGIVETHGRPRTTERLEGLEVVPRRAVEHRGTTQHEMDLEAVLRRAPDVCLVDELAHSNVPGLDHAKRWQDVETLLAAGIDVVTTVNIQHLESLNDVTEAITGVRQRETVPDRFVRSADAIELVDMSPQALRRRLAHGNVYAAEKVDAALGQFFREGNLAALRELALLWLADRVDEGLDRYRAQHSIDSTWAARERIVVGVTGGPESESLMRRASRIASRTGGGEWHALYVTRGDGLRQTGPERLEALRRTTEELGGTFHTVVGDDSAAGILDYARGVNASQVLVGASRRGRISTLLRPGIGETVIAESGDIDVHIVTHAEARRSAAVLRQQGALGRRRSVAGFALGLVGPPLVTALLLATPDLHGLPSESMLFMALVVGVALLGGVWPALVAAVLSGGLLNYYFTSPLRSLRIASAENLVAVVIFVVVGLAVALVVDRAARLAVQAARSRREADTLSVLAHNLVHAGDDLPRLLAAAVELVGLRGAAVVDANGSVLVAQGEPPMPSPDAALELGAGDRLLLRGGPVRSQDQPLLQAVAAHATVLLERERARAESAERRALAEGERMRTGLLAAVSHDLRSPLAAAKASVSSLRDDSVAWSDQDRADLLETIEESTDRLDALISDLLDMSRLQTGSVSAHAHRVDLHAVVQRVLSRTPADRVRSQLPEDLPDVVADAGLLERVLANVVENAVQHGAPGAVRVDGAVAGDRVVVRVVDSGPGVAPSRHEQLFEPFQRLGDAPGGTGVGLGLAVARGFAEAMGGSLTAEDTPGGGLTVVLDLPLAPRSLS